MGVLSLLLTEFPAHSIPREQISNPWLFKISLIINPAILLLIAVITGMLLYHRLNLNIPVFDSIAGRVDRSPVDIKKILVYGMATGILSGTLIHFIAVLFHPFLPEVLYAGSSDMPVITRLLYGGITEELLLRFGLMTLILWVLFRLTGKLNSIKIWIAIAATALIFALGHLPVLFQFVASPSIPVYIYIILANGIGGIFFGYLYSKGPGLESAMIAHVVTHLTMIFSEYL